MTDSNAEKNKELLREIEVLKKQVLHLEKKISDSEGKNTYLPRENRADIKTEIMLVGDFDHVKANSVNISESGICFDLAEPLMFEMKYCSDKQYIKRAKLLWMKKNSDNTFRLGMHFEDEKT